MPHFRKTLVVMVLLLAFVAVMGTIPVFANTSEVDADKATVQLTETQKKELAALHKEILAKKKELISKYVEYGVMSKEKGEKIISRLEKRYERLEKNGFIPQWDKSKGKNSR
jgi:DNA-binding transcriptional regulator WhiA